MERPEADKPLQNKSFNSLKEFYPYYLSEHKNPISRRLHLLGSSIGAICLIVALYTWQWGYVLAGLIMGYGLAWIGHFFFEHNRPATFKHPIYSFCCDWIMYKDIITGKIPF